MILKYEIYLKTTNQIYGYEIDFKNKIVTKTQR